MNPMSLPNVTVSPKLLGTFGATRDNFGFPYAALAEVVWELASKNPMWELRIVAAASNGNARKLSVYQDGEQVGEIGYEYNSRSGGNTVYITNQRIAALRSRNNGRMFSSDTKKLIATARKMFSKKTVGELVTEAESHTHTAMNTLIWEHSSSVSRIKTSLWESAIAFVTGDMKPLFVQHLMATGQSALLPKVEQLEEANANLTVSSSLKMLYDAKQLALVVLDNDKYIVKYSINTELHDTESLPSTLRRSLGMLKLVEKGQVVSNSGMRVSDTVFLVVQDEE